MLAWRAGNIRGHRTLPKSTSCWSRSAKFSHVLVRPDRTGEERIQDGLLVQEQTSVFVWSNYGGCICEPSFSGTEVLHIGYTKLAQISKTLFWNHQWPPTDWDNFKMTTTIPSSAVPFLKDLSHDNINFLVFKTTSLRLVFHPLIKLGLQMRFQVHHAQTYCMRGEIS